MRPWVRVGQPSYEAERFYNAGGENPEKQNNLGFVLFRVLCFFGVIFFSDNFWKMFGNEDVIVFRRDGLHAVQTPCLNVLICGTMKELTLLRHGDRENIADAKQKPHVLTSKAGL